MLNSLPKQVILSCLGTSLLLIIFLTGCSTQTFEENKATTYYETEFFKRVQLSGIFKDSKTFVDCEPNKGLSDILADYERQKEQDRFDLEVFVNSNFELPTTAMADFATDSSKSMDAHIEMLWDVLTRTKDTASLYGSLIPLPQQYVVPGGRFREIYYWDSYFTMLGLLADDRRDLAGSMLENFAFLIDSLGFIPNGNRDYYLGRSQPPFFALMVDLVAGDNRDKFISYQSAMLTEYNFWMEGSNMPTTETEHLRVVKVNDSTMLNRYFDAYDTPRPESFREDYELAKANELPPSETYRHLRAGAESGWDYSSRWFRDKMKLQTIHTTHIIPIDLNSLLYFLELKIAQSYNWQGALEKAELYLDKAAQRKNAINSILWSNKNRFYMDYDFKVGQHTEVVSMAAVYPLFFNIADKAKSKSVIEMMNNELLMPGGLAATNINTGQQWDLPNAWAPHQWIGMQACFNYNNHKAGFEIANRWLSTNRKIYHSTGKMMEKYNVVDTTLTAGGGEYPLQDGFGWTNGVAAAMLEIIEKQKKFQTTALSN